MIAFNLSIIIASYAMIAKRKTFTTQNCEPMPLISNQGLTSTTQLDATGLPFIEIVLTERFLLPPDALLKIGEKIPTTIGEIVELSGMPLQYVCDVIQECLTIGNNIFVEIPSLTTAAQMEGTIVVDMSQCLDIHTQPLHDSARMFHAQNPQQLLPFLRTMDRVLVISHTEAHAWSAAMSLRKMDIKAWLPQGWHPLLKS